MCKITSSMYRCCITFHKKNAQKRMRVFTLMIIILTFFQWNSNVTILFTNLYKIYGESSRNWNWWVLLGVKVYVKNPSSSPPPPEKAKICMRWLLMAQFYSNPLLRKKRKKHWLILLSVNKYVWIRDIMLSSSSLNYVTLYMISKKPSICPTVHAIFTLFCRDRTSSALRRRKQQKWWFSFGFRVICLCFLPSREPEATTAAHTHHNYRLTAR